MPGTGPVYQPTTVSYESRPGLLAQTAATVTSPMVWLRRPLPQTVLLICALATIAAGVAMIVNGAADYEDTELHRAELAARGDINDSSPDSSSEEAAAANDADAADKEAAAAAAAGETVDVALVVAGVVLTVIGFILAGLYVKVAEWRRSYVCPCGLSKKHQGLARQMQQDGAGGGLGMVGSGGGGVGNGGGAQIMAMNPSTDPLVSHTQYAPVSELPRPEDEECRTLMLDNKECLSSAEESDRMLDADPRIVLRPLGHVEEA